MNQMLNRQISEKISDVLGQRSEVRFAYLFGSRIEGVSGDESDLDLGLYLDEKVASDLESLYETQLSLEIEESLRGSLEIDPVILNHRSLPFKYQVVRKGELIYFKDEAEARDFEAFTIKKYLDFYPMRKEYNDERLKKYGVSG